MTAGSYAREWARTRTFHHSRYSPAGIAAARAERGLGVSVCLPARECAGTVGEIVAALGSLREAGAIDQIVVVDAASEDGTAAVAARAGASASAEVHQEAELMPWLGPVLGKGDAMYRALAVLTGDVVCYLDADTEGFSAHYATGLIGPLVCEAPGEPPWALREPSASREPLESVKSRESLGPPGSLGSPEPSGGEIAFVKAFYRRPFAHGGVSLPEGGGRVNHLMARPALELFYPELAGVRQPLAGEVAARRELLERVPFAPGYGVEVAMLIDVCREVGLEGMAQVDLDEHRNRHQPLMTLTRMAGTVLRTVVERAQDEGRLDGFGSLVRQPVDRPPLADVARR